MVLMWLEAWGGALGLWRDRGAAMRRAAAPVMPPAVWMPQTGRPVRRERAASRRVAARRPFWIRVDPQDSRHAAIGGSFAEVCAALERLAAEENAPGR